MWCEFHKISKNIQMSPQHTWSFQKEEQGASLSSLISCMWYHALEDLKNYAPLFENQCNDKTGQ